MPPIQTSSLSTPRTARVFQLGSRSADLQEVWILLHGYGQSARHFLEKFEGWTAKNTLLLAPEGLSRFYVQGLDGRVGASWMTREDRENEIQDQLEYLNRLIAQFDLESNCRLNLLGFSQGAAVVCRWYQTTPIRVKNLVLWGAGLPIETTEKMAQKYNHTNCIFMLGTEDEFLKPEVLKDHFSRLDLLNFPHQVIRYEGGHTVTKAALKQLDSILLK